MNSMTQWCEREPPTIKLNAYAGSTYKVPPPLKALNLV